MKYKTVIFDFDGTIADTFSTVIDIVNGLAEDYGFAKLTLADISELRHMQPHNMLKIFKISWFKLPALIFAVKATLGKRIATISAFPDMKSVLLELESMDCTLGIVSSNNRETVMRFLKNNEIDIFDFVYCEKNLFGKGKVLKNVLSKHAIAVEESLYVGDETRDVRAGHEATMKVVSVGWGYNAVTTLERMHPEWVITHPEELVEIVKGISI